jgi:serine/threonine protein kinase
MFEINADDDGNVAQASRSTDMYAFGIVMHEVLSGKTPYEGMAGVNAFNFEDRIDQGLRPAVTAGAVLPIDTPPSIVDLMQRCWDKERRARPAAAECLSTLQHELSVFEKKHFDVFFSHPWAKKPFLSNLFSVLHKRGYRVWYDQNDMGYDLQKSMREGIANSTVTVACIDDKYQIRENCLTEIDHAFAVLRKPTVAVLTQSDAASWVQDTITTLRDKVTREGLKPFYTSSVQAGTVVDLGALAALPGWGEDGGKGTTEDMLRQLEAAAKPLIEILTRLGCKPSMEVT